MLHHSRNDDEFARVYLYVTIPELHDHRAFGYQEELVLVVVVATNERRGSHCERYNRDKRYVQHSQCGVLPIELALELDDLDVHPIHLSNDLRAPVVTELSEAILQVDECAARGVGDRPLGAAANTIR